MLADAAQPLLDAEGYLAPFAHLAPLPVASDDTPGISLLVTTELTDEGFRRATLTCLLTDNDQVAFRPRRCIGTQAEATLSTLHPDIRTIGGTTSLSW